MAIRITRNEAGNCITFVGSSNPAYWNSCLSAQLNEGDADRVDIINDIRTSNETTTQYEFYAVRYEDFADRDNNSFNSAQEMVDYVNANANVIGLSTEVGKGLTDVSVDFRHDATSTSIIMDNGFAFGVNTIKAVGDADGTIHIHAIGTGTPDNGDSHTRKHFEKLDHTNVSINGTAVPGGLQDVVNALNEYFTVGAFEAVVISDPYSTLIADVAGVDAGYTLEGTTSVDPVGADVFGNTGTGNYAGLKSTATIDQAGEYYTFDIRGEGQIGFGLVHTQDSYDAGHYTGNASYANPASFATSNSAHFGYQFSHWFHPTPNGSWTNYGANTSYSMRPGWSNWDQQQDWIDGNPVKIRTGIDTNGYISIESLQDDGSWVVHARSGYPVPEGSEYHLGIKASGSAPRVFSAPKVHLLEEEAPTMYFRYIESPDGVFNYPLFATQEEADYYDKTTQGTETGESHTHVYVDDPTNTQWYMPDHGATMAANAAPSGATFDGNPINYTEITSLTNADLVPPAFADTTLTVDELSAVNYQLSPADVGYTTTIGGIPAWSLVDGTTLMGTAPEVTGNNVDNPSDTTTVTVYRTNSYGTSSGTLTINITNLTAAPVTPITGVTLEGGTALVDSDTMDDGSVISVDNVVNVGNRFTIDKEWLDNYVLPKITSGSGAKAVFVGFPSSSANYSSVGFDDFIMGYQFYSDDTLRSQNNWRLRTISNSTIIHNVGIGGQTSGLYDYALINDGTDIQFGSLVASQGHDISTYVYATSAADSNWNYTGGLSGVTSQNRDVIIATSGTDMDIDLQYFNEYTEPTPPVTNLTSWTKALDFSGSNEHGKQVSTSTSYNALRMRGYNVTTIAPAAGYTSNSSAACPWATAIVFKADGNNSNQHIWNSGDGTATNNDDNIYLRLDASGNLYFGWGRSGSLNECVIGAGFNAGAGINQFWGVYIAHNGTRLNASNATATKLAACFDIRIMNNQGGTWQIAGAGGTFADASGNRSTVTNWSRSGSNTGGRMDRSVTGDFTVGGRGSNRSFHGKVASMVVTTLKLNDTMPSEAELTLMVTDPVKWATDYKHNQSARYAGGNSNFTFKYNDNNTASWGATQIWLMGDGSNDSYSNMIRNQVGIYDQNYTKLNLISMVSNDIQNVTIPGLS